jgi:hypothetical protein
MSGQTFVCRLVLGERNSAAGAGSKRVAPHSSCFSYPEAFGNLETMTERRLSDVGGTPGGLGSFVIGLIMVGVGGYLLTNQVIVTSSSWTVYGTNAFGISLIPLLFGVALLFWNSRSWAGWLLTVAGALFILAGIIANLHIYFQATSMFNTLIMLVMLVGGLGLIARALRSA